MPKFFKSLSNFLTGTPEKRENVSTLRPEQENLFQQLQNALKGSGAGGAFGNSADFYRNLLSDDSADFDAFSAPQLRQFNEDIIPGISEQFAGMGAGGLSSSGFRNAATQAATDLSERLGAIRANLRQSGAQGLSNLGQLGLGNFSQNMTTEPGTSGFLSDISPLAGTVAGTLLGGPAGGALGNLAGNWLSSNFGNKVGKNSSPYGSQSPKASPSSGFQLPSFLQGNGGF